MNHTRETKADCISNYFLKTLKDDDILKLYKTALHYSQNQIKVLRDLFQKEFPVPQGFTGKDFNLKAQPLFHRSLQFVLFI
ncbi:DUF3231 family protein [Cytobacillus oceanisediminis]|uniref:Uncharacterized protein DUF3231 n=1 Tax=Cytobacillus oceanisediminis TaxID=665099 RepID=A0A562K7I3_9BACI|nr:uncharacterized protein DUF3231 [Cytobacillus oceanisediminis]